MTTINLHQNQQENQSRSSMKNENRGFVFSLAILGFVLLMLAGLKLYVPFAENKNKAFADEVTRENNNLVELKSLERVVDMQQRLKDIKENLQLKEGKISRLEMTQLLDDLAGDLGGGIVVSDFKFDGELVTVSFEASNFNDVAKQILNFKKSEKFTNVNLVSMARKESVVICSVSMKIKK